jgi:membrane associated rhomboid family serine protease
MKKMPVYTWLFAISAAALFLPDEVLQRLMIAPGGWLSPQLITHLFVHAGPEHLLGNFILCLAPGLYLERRLGRARFLLFYLLAGVGSAWMFLLCSPWGSAAGASGAIFGVITYALLLWMREGKWQAVMSFIIFCYAVIPNLQAAASVSFDGIAHWGHVGGWIAALFLAHFIKPVKRIVYEKRSH